MFNEEYLCINDVSEFITPQMQVKSFDCLPNGLHIACVHDNIIQIYDIVSGIKVRQHIIGQLIQIRHIRYLINGELLFSGDDHKIYVWDHITEQFNGQPLSGHTNYIQSLAISSNELYLASSSQDQTIRIWTLKDRICQQIIPVAGAHSLQYSIPGNQLYYISYNSLQILLNKSKLICQVYSRKPISHVQTNNNLLVYSSRKQAQIQDKYTGKNIRKVYLGEDDIDGIVISPHKKFVVMIGEVAMSVYDINRGIRYGPFLDDNDLQFFSVKFSKDSKCILIRNYYGVLKIELSVIFKSQVIN